MSQEQAIENGDHGGETKKKENKPASFREYLLGLGAVGNVGIQIWNIGTAAAVYSTNKVGGTLTSRHITECSMRWSSSGLATINSPWAMYKERQLTKEDTLRTALNGIREQQGRLAGENDKLSSEIDELQSEVDRMKDIELALRELSEVQGTQMNELLDLVRQNKEINEGVRAVLRKKALEEVISLVLDIDNDGSFTIQHREIDRLIIGMRLMDDIKFNEEMFREDLMDCGGKVDEVIELIKAMLYGSSDSKCKIEMDDPEDWFKKQRNRSGGF